MSKPCCAIDVHTHVVPANLPDERPEFAGLPWPSIRHTDACHAQVIISGKNFRDINMTTPTFVRCCAAAIWKARADAKSCAAP